MAATQPQCTRIYRNHHIDSTRWDGFSPREDDIVISTSIKSGTTWVQTIVRELIVHSLNSEQSQNPDQIPLPDNGSSFWIEASFSRDAEAMHRDLEAQKHRRFIKSHVPLDGLPFYPQIKYLIIGRDARDVFMSLWNHFSDYEEAFYARLDELGAWMGEPCPRCPDDIHTFWHSWINQSSFEWEKEGYPFWGNMHHAQTWWQYRDLDNVEFLHYADLLTDPASEIGRMANFLDINVSEADVAEVVEYTNLSTMRQRKLDTGAAINFLKGGVSTFFNKGTNGRWRGILSDNELAMYERTKSQVLSLDCAHWLEQGRQALE